MTSPTVAPQCAPGAPETSSETRSDARLAVDAREHALPAQDGPIRHVVIVVRSACRDPGGATAVEIQVPPLLDTLARLGISSEVVEIIDGSEDPRWGRAHPVLADLVDRVRRGAVDLVMARDADRLGRGPDRSAWGALLAAAAESGTLLHVGGRFIRPLESRGFADLLA